MTRYAAPAVDAALAIVEALAAAPELGVTELARRQGMGKSSVHRLLATLAARGYVEKNPATERYRLTYRLYAVGSAATERYGLRELAQPAMERLAADAGETANLGVLDGGRVVNLHKVLGPHPVRLHIDAVGGVPAHATALGKVLLADLPADELDRRLGSRPLVRLTSKTIGDRAVLRAELARVGQRGYAVDDEECSPGLRCVAAPVRDRLGAVVAAVSVSGPARRLPRQRLVGLGSAVRAAALAISRRLGFEPAPAAAGRAAGRSHVRPTPAPPARRRSA